MARYAQERPLHGRCLSLPWAAAVLINTREEAAKSAPKANILAALLAFIPLNPTFSTLH